MTGLPTITIVTPSYNQASFLEATIRSVLDQGYPNLEYIIMDGGSTDGSVDIIRRYADRLTFWVSEPDKGQADAIFRGFEKGSGTILGWLNSDDCLLPGALEQVGRYFQSHPETDCAVGGCVIVDAHGNLLKDRQGFPDFTYGVRVTFNSLLYCGCGFNQPASFWRREAFFSTGGFDRSLRFCFDYDLFIRLARRAPFGRIDAFLACFRMHEESKTSTLQDVRHEENVLLWERYGRYRGSSLLRRVREQYYYRRYLLEHRYYQMKILAGMVKLPVIPAMVKGEHGAGVL